MYDEETRNPHDVCPHSRILNACVAEDSSIWTYIYECLVQGTKKRGFVVHTEQIKEKSKRTQSYLHAYIPHNHTYTPTYRYTCTILQNFQTSTERPANQYQQTNQLQDIHKHLQPNNPTIELYPTLT